MEVAGRFFDPEVTSGKIHSYQTLSDGHVSMHPDFNEGFSAYIDEALGIDNQGLAIEMWFARHLSVQEIAEQLCFSVKTIKRWIDQEQERRQDEEWRTEEARLLGTRPPRIWERRKRQPGSHATYESMRDQLRDGNYQAFVAFVAMTAHSGRRIDVALKLRISLRSLDRLLRVAREEFRLNWKEHTSPAPPDLTPEETRIGGLVHGGGYGYAAVAEMCGCTTDEVWRVAERYRRVMAAREERGEIGDHWRRMGHLELAGNFMQTGVLGATHEPDESWDSPAFVVSGDEERASFQRPDSSEWRRAA